MDDRTFINSLKSFELISELITSYSPGEIVETVADLCDIDKDELASSQMGCRSKGGTSGCYYNVLEDLKENIQHYKWLYSMLSDEISKKVFLNLMRYRVFPSLKYIKNACDKNHDQYFDEDIIHCDNDEVFVDCGGFIGHTTESFIDNYKDYKRVYIYEPLQANVVKCRNAIKNYKNVCLRPFGVGKKEEVEVFQDASSALPDTEVKLTSLDNDIQESVSFIKMDIDGFEIEAIIGAKNHIKNDHPKLAICVYHIVSDIWEIPQLIYSINPDYDFYLRHYRDDQNCETVIYAIPKVTSIEKLPWVRESQAGVYSFSVDGCWNNQQLTKDCGTVPYLLHKNYGYNAVMVGEKAGEYPYLETYVKGLSMDFIPDKNKELTYIVENYQNMDVVLLYGAFIEYSPLLNLYRKLRPDGKVYLALDANSFWMDRIWWNRPEFLHMLDQCDVIAASNKIMQEFLSKKWPYKIEYIPNGFYNYSGFDLDSMISKENTILTVGRIGLEAKQNDILLEAFAKAYDQIPGWTLKLVGGIESSFQKYIEDYFQKYPHLREKVIFTGLIEDKKELMLEYKKAKIFALSSCSEGSPNVASEALFGGCYIITSKLDACEEITNHGFCGQVFQIGDKDELSRILSEVCNNEQLIEEGSKNALEYAKHTFDFNKIIERLHYLLVG